MEGDQSWGLIIQEDASISVTISSCLSLGPSAVHVIVEWRIALKLLLALVRSKRKLFNG